MPLPEKDARSLAAERDGSAVDMLCLGMQRHTTGVGWADQEGSASPLSVPHARSHLYFLVLKLIHVQLTTTHPQPIQLKIRLFSQVSFLQQAHISSSACRTATLALVLAQER